jgi:hypothetical protein
VYLILEILEFLNDVDIHLDLFSKPCPQRKAFFFNSYKDFIEFLSLIFSSYKTGTGKNRPLLEAMRPLYPLVAFVALSYYWVRTSPNDIMDLDPRAVFITTGTIFSNICVSGFQIFRGS